MPAGREVHDREPARAPRPSAPGRPAPRRSLAALTALLGAKTVQPRRSLAGSSACGAPPRRRCPVPASPFVRIIAAPSAMRRSASPEVARAAHERDRERPLVDVVLLVGRRQHLGLVDVVHAERLEDLRLDEVPDPSLRHHRDRDGVHDLLDLGRVGHARDPALRADVRRHALERHDGAGAGVLGDLGLLGGGDVHDDAALQHLGQSGLHPEGAGLALHGEPSFASRRTQTPAQRVYRSPSRPPHGPVGRPLPVPRRRRVTASAPRTSPTATIEAIAPTASGLRPPSARGGGVGDTTSALVGSVVEVGELEGGGDTRLRAAASGKIAMWGFACV